MYVLFQIVIFVVDDIGLLILLKELEKGIIWEYDTINNEWSRGVIRIKVAEVWTCLFIHLFY